MELSRRDVIKFGVGAAAVSALRPLSNLLAQAPLITKAIPSSGERIPIVGIGTRDFGGGSPVPREEYKEVLRQLPALGGKVVDTANGYQGGASETLIGEVVSELGNRDRLFLATKVNASGKQAGVSQIEQSFQRLRTKSMDLIAVHNIRDTATQLETLREMKQAGRIRYVGITTSDSRQYAEFETIMKGQALDFVQVDYALDNREAADRILPLAADRGMAVMVNLPFGRGRLFAAVQNRALPDWAKEIDCTSWAQIFLKYIVADSAVTCAIPGTRRVPHLTDNIKGAQGRLPDAAMRRRMEQFIESV
ncbi:MAG: aldo/keto reductase [Acidobacteria bacterium]|nr:aldo/keto reductase [Acidobacteriota bacterium]